MAFDRSKYKAANLAIVKSEQKRVEKFSKTWGGQEGYIPFHKIEDGVNVFRVLPTTKEDQSPYVAVRTSKLPVKSVTYDEKGNKTGEEVKPKNVFIATIHSAGKMEKDPIELYIGYVYEQAKEIQDKEERNKFLNPIKGYKGSKGFVWGIAPATGYVCYATNESGSIGKLQLRENWMKKMQEISVEQSDNEVVSIDIFSEPNDGFPLKITKGHDPKKKQDTYDINFVNLSKNQTWPEFFEEHKVKDETLIELESYQSLQDLYVGVYTRKDWDMAVEGLERFDAQNGYGIFENEDFLNEMEKLDKEVPEAKEEDEKEEEKPVKKQPPTKKVEKELPSMAKMKMFLREYIDELYEGEKELPEELSKEEIAEWYELAQKDEKLPFPKKTKSVKEPDPEPEEQEDEPETETEQKEESAVDRVRRLRAQRGK